MDPQVRKMFEEILDLSQKNNQILRSIRRSMRLASLTRIIYWIVVIGFAVGAYYYIQPYVDSLINASLVFKENLEAASKILSSVKSLR